MFLVGQNVDMDYRPQKVWRYKGHRILTWTEDDGVGVGPTDVVQKEIA